jgi:hypothetical protein
MADPNGREIAGMNQRKKRTQDGVVLWTQRFERNSLARFKEFEQALATFSIDDRLKELAGDLECVAEGPRRP